MRRRNAGLASALTEREPRAGRRPGQPLPVSSVWCATLALLVVVVLGLGSASFASTQYQRTAFDDTTSQLERELDAVVSLVRELRTVDVPMGTVFYQFGTPDELAEQLRIFMRIRKDIDGRFDHAKRVVPVRSKENPLAAARASWDKTAQAVVAAQRFWGTTKIQDALASGEDPFSDEWTQLRQAQGSLTEVTAESLGALRAQRAQVDRVQRLIPAIVLASLAVALLIGAVAARRMSRHIVGPLKHLRNAAARMRDGDLLTQIDLGAAPAELRDLAGAMNDLARSLHTSQGLLIEQTRTDALTGLPNRHALMQHLHGQDLEDRSDGIALLFIDLDDFKVVNDTLGHEAGDTLVRIVGQRLRASARNGDVVARLGGDEFAIAIAIDQGRDPSVALAVAKRVLASFSEPVSIAGNPVRVGCSIGVALSGQTSAPAEELLRNADVAMYMAKGRGKNRIELFAPVMHTEMLARMNLKADLAHATERGELVLHYQPVVDLDRHEVLGWEALVRWQHPERGLVPPTEFIPLAEDTGDILTIGWWVLDRACADVTTLLGGPEHTGRWVSVNVSARQLENATFVDTIRTTLHRHGVNPRSLVLEITETALITDTTQAAETLTLLQRDGLRIALDDFGTGFSSLRYLQQLPVDIIKMDRSFVTKDASAGQRSMVEAIVTLGTALGLEIIAEGIEGVEEMSDLQKFHRLAGQGNHLAQPMSLAAARTFALQPIHQDVAPVIPAQARAAVSHEVAAHHACFDPAVAGAPGLEVGQEPPRATA